VARHRGLFGPDSMSWRIIGHPAALVGGLRALLLQALHPLAMAGVAQHSNYLEDPMGRLRRTAGYVSTITFGSLEEAEAAADRVRSVHRSVHGTDPVTGRRYSASDPATMVWVHCVEAHSFLAAYRAYVRPLARADQDRYLAEQVDAAALLGVPRARVPDSVAAYRDYFASVRGELRTSPDAEAAIAFVRRPTLPDLPPAQRVVLHPAFRAMGDAATALVPGSLRDLAGLPGRGPRDLPSRLAVGAAANALAAASAVPVLRTAVEQPISRTLGTRRRPRPAAAA
jgi:uncharacterized protein (DUF2236 family)